MTTVYSGYAISPENYAEARKFIRALKKAGDMNVMMTQE